MSNNKKLQSVDSIGCEASYTLGDDTMEKPYNIVGKRVNLAKNASKIALYSSVLMASAGLLANGCNHALDTMRKAVWKVGTTATMQDVNGDGIQDIVLNYPDQPSQLLLGTESGIYRTPEGLEHHEEGQKYLQGVKQ